jgi:long-subunit fatty acid transport protein
VRLLPPLASAVLGALLLTAAPAHGAGFDTPILYTARHQAMGGTAIGYVDDASATFHNPAGLHGVRGVNLIGDLSLILGRVRASPERTVTSVESELTIAPFFLLGGAVRLNEFVTFGLGVFPVASGGAEYEYELAGNPIRDATSIVFAEATPALAVSLPRDRFVPGTLSLGAGYRASALWFTREKGNPEDPRLLNFDMFGTNFSGFRLGLQYRPAPVFGFGFVFRNKIEIETRADSASVYTQTAEDATLSFVLPAKLGGGVVFDLGRVRLASDAEYAFQSQNRRSMLRGTLGDSSAEVPNVFAWEDGVTLRFGAEYRLGDEERAYPLRVGYLFDSTVTNAAYPSAFGTPPAPTQTFTFGGGYRTPSFQVNAAVTHRFGSTSIAAEELGSGCAFCSYDGDYSITMTGFYLDASVDFGS